MVKCFVTLLVLLKEAPTRLFLAVPVVRQEIGRSLKNFKGRRRPWILKYIFRNKEIYLIYTILTIVPGFEVNSQVKHFINVNQRGIRRRTDNMFTWRMTKLQLMCRMQDEKLLSPSLEIFWASFIFPSSHHTEKKQNPWGSSKQ